MSASSSVKFEEQIGNMYAQLELDCIIELAIAVAHDSKKRPNIYKDTKIASLLTNLVTKVGNDPDWPNREQRMEYYLPFFSSSSSFSQLKTSMLEAAQRFAERVYDSGEAMLLQAFVDKAVIYHAGLKTIEGNLFDETNKRTKAIFNEAVKVFKDDGVAKAFGLPPAKGSDWPIEYQPSGEGSVLAGAISETIKQPNHVTVSAEQFLMLQLLSARGKQTFTNLPDACDPSKVKDLIRSSYSWLTASSSSLVRSTVATKISPATSPRLATNNVVRKP